MGSRGDEEIMITFVAAVFVFGILTFFHELGHFMAARYYGIKVYEFSLGFGLSFFDVKRGDTLYSLRLIPLGGYVKMAGTDPDEEGETEYNAPHSFNQKSVWQRFWVIAAGPLMNFVLAILLLATIFMVYGMKIPTSHVGNVLEGSPAERFGIQPGYKIIEVNSIPVNNWADLTKEINKSAGKEIVLKLEKDGDIYQKVVVPELDEDGRYIIGIQPDPNNITVERLNPFAAIWQGMKITLNVSIMIVTFLGKMIIGAEPPDLSGPVKIVSVIGDAAQTGFFQLLQLTAFLSINIGLLNLFPIPALDGSRLVFLLVEKIRGKPIDPTKEGFIHMIGFGLLMLMIVVVTFNDIQSLFNSK